MTLKTIWESLSEAEIFNLTAVIKHFFKNQYFSLEASPVTIPNGPNQILKVMKLKYKYASCQREGERLFFFFEYVGILLITMAIKENPAYEVIRMRMWPKPDFPLSGRKGRLSGSLGPSSQQPAASGSTTPRKGFQALKYFSCYANIKLSRVTTYSTYLLAASPNPTSGKPQVL